MNEAEQTAVVADESAARPHPWAELAPEHYRLLRLAPLPTDRTTGARPLRFLQLGRVERHNGEQSLLRLSVQVPGQDSTELSYVPGAPVLENLHHFGVYTLLTSTGGWDTGRAITNALAIALLGPAVLTTLRRASRRARITRVEA